MPRDRPLDALLVLVLGMQRWVGARVVASRSVARAPRAAAGRASSGGGAPRPEPGRARGAPRAGPGERSRAREPAVDWVARFTEELAGIARMEGSGPAPKVVPSHAVPNVGANAEVVLVNPRWMEQTSVEICGDQASCRRDLVRGIAAHEWSHVIDARRGGVRAAPDHGKELEADRMAGRVLARSGASARPLMRLLGADRAGPSLTHPSAGDRVGAVLAGQADAREGCSGECARRCCDAAPREPRVEGEPLT